MEDQELLAAFLRRTSRMTIHEAGLASGLSHETVRKYRLGKVTRITSRTRRLLEAFLQGEGPRRGASRGERPAPYRGKIAKLEEELAAVKLAAGRRQWALDLLSANFEIIPFEGEVGEALQVTWISPEAARVTGFDPAHVVASADFWFSRLHPQEVDEVERDFASARQKGLGQLNYLWRMADGAYTPFTMFLRFQGERCVGVWVTPKDLHSLQVVDSYVPPSMALA